MENSNIYLAADSGGSKTVWILLNENGDKIFEYKTEGLGAVKSGILPVYETVAEAEKNLRSYGSIKGIYLSLGGPNTDEVSDALRMVWKNVNIKVEREALGNAMLYAASFLNCSGVVMCGTGSTAMGIKNEVKCYCGGWGPIYGDGGSGGGMGSAALKAYLRNVDGFCNIGEVADLFINLENGLNIKEFEDRMELKSRAVNMSRREIAALAPKIYSLMEKGDAFATKLYEDAALEIALMADAVSDSDKDVKVLLCGGFFANKPKLIDMCKKIFSEKSKADLYYDDRFSPIAAACLTVLKDNNIEINNELFNKILNF